MGQKSAEQCDPLLVSRFQESVVCWLLGMSLDMRGGWLV